MTHADHRTQTNCQNEHTNEFEVPYLRLERLHCRSISLPLLNVSTGPRGKAMTLPNISKLTLTELKQLQRDLNQAILGYEDRKRSEALSELHERAKELGFSLAELTGTRKPRKNSGSPGPKYRHPENPEITWSGRGRRPGWFDAATKAGKSAESMAV